MEKKQTIIILDDHPIIIDGIKLLLQGLDNYELDTAATSIRELLSLLTFDHNILIMDINIKGESSLPYITDIRLRFPKLKILILSSYNNPSLVKRAIDAKIEGYLLKDTTKNELLLALDAIRNGVFFAGSTITQYAQTKTHQYDDQWLDDNFEKINQLSKRELIVLKLMAMGLKSQEIANKLCISQHTVQSHRKNILQKLNLHSISDVIRFVYDNKLNSQ